VQDIDIREMGRYPGAEFLPKEVRYINQDHTVERPVYVDNVVEKIVQVPVERIIENIVEKVIDVPMERVIERPVYIDNIVHKQVEIPVHKTVEVHVEKVVEVPVHVDNIIERPVPIERIVERKIEIPVERIIDVPIYVDNIIHKQIDIVKEVEIPIQEERNVENIVERRDEAIAINEYLERPYERVYERPVKVGGSQTVSVDFIIEKNIFVPRENVFEIAVPQINARQVDREIVKHVNIERIVERPVAVERPVEVLLRRYIEMPKFTENVVEKEVPIEATIERIIERLIEKKVEVPVEKIIEVPVTIHVERGQINERVTEEIVEREAVVIQAVQGSTQEGGVVEIEDQQIEAEIRKNQAETQRLQSETSRWSQEIISFRTQASQITSVGFGRLEEEYLNLKSRISELESRHNVIDQDTQRLLRKSQTTQQRVSVAAVVEDPQVEVLRRELKELINENRRLVGTIKSFRVVHN
jgi:hypothetical protein